MTTRKERKIFTEMHEYLTQVGCNYDPQHHDIIKGAWIAYLAKNADVSTLDIDILIDDTVVVVYLGQELEVWNLLTNEPIEYISPTKIKARENKLALYGRSVAKQESLVKSHDDAIKDLEAKIEELQRKVEYHKERKIKSEQYLKSSIAKLEELQC